MIAVHILKEGHAALAPSPMAFEFVRRRLGVGWGLANSASEADLVLIKRDGAYQFWMPS